MNGHQNILSFRLFIVPSRKYFIMYPQIYLLYYYIMYLGDIFLPILPSSARKASSLFCQSMENIIELGWGKLMCMYVPNPGGV
jgi:hypothetical protein